MPFYIRGGQDIPTPTISSCGSDSEDNYALDPQQQFDELPQPFRLINKVLDEIINIAWDKISAAEIERELESKRVYPPTYLPFQSLEYSNVTCICPTESDLYFLGTTKSVIAFNKTSKERVATWEPQDEVSVEKISCVVSNDLYLLAVQDDMGFLRKLIFDGELFHPVIVYNEQIEGSPKSNAFKVELSKDGEFCAIALESDNVGWIEVYRLPVENWRKEIDNARKEFLKKAESMAASSKMEVDDTEKTEQPNVTPSEMLFPTIKFSMPPLVLKVNRPPEVFPSSANTAQEIYDQVSMGEVIGDGSVHALTEKYLKNRKLIFDRYVQEKNFLVLEEEPVKIQTYFHFLTPSCMEPKLSGNLKSKYSLLGVWWTDHNVFSIYQLGKTGKNVEFKPDSVWPQASYITASALSDDDTLLAFGIDNGSVTLWNRKIGILLTVFNACPEIPVNSLVFLPTSTTDNIDLLVGSANGQISLYQGIKRVQKSATMNVHTLVPAPTNEDEVFTLLSAIPTLPGFFLVLQRNGELNLRSISQKHILCKLTLPDQCIIDHPFETACVAVGQGKALYVRGSIPSSSENMFFIFDFLSFPVLEYFSETENEIPFTIERPGNFMELAQELLTKRQRKHAERTAQLKSRWHNLHRQIDIVMKLRENVTMNKRDASASESLWGRTTTRIIAHNKDLRN